MICAILIETNGNILVLEGTQDSPAFKQFWGTHGPRALANVRAAKPHLPPSSDLAGAEMDAFLSSNSAKGIVRQAVTGAGNEYVKLANVLVSKHVRFDAGVGHCYLGGERPDSPRCAARWPAPCPPRCVCLCTLREHRHRSAPCVCPVGFYAAAPWPLGNAKRALSEMRAAVAVEPKSRRNQYYVCLLLYQAGEKRKAGASCAPLAMRRGDGGPCGADGA